MSQLVVLLFESFFLFFPPQVCFLNFGRLRLNDDQGLALFSPEHGSSSCAIVIISRPFLSVLV